MRRALFDLGRRNLPHERGQQQTAGQLQNNLHVADRVVVRHAKELETSGQEKRISRQPDERFMDHAVGTCYGELTELEQIFGHTAVKQCVGFDLRKILQHPQPHHRAARQSERDAQPVHLSAQRRQLTLHFSLHTIRNVERKLFARYSLNRFFQSSLERGASSLERPFWAAECMEIALPESRYAASTLKLPDRMN